MVVIEDMHLETRLRMILLTGCFLMVLCHPPQAAFGQSFVNLDFESANVSGYPRGSYVPISSALPGWSGYFTSSTATNQTMQVGYDFISLGGNVISVNDSNTGFGFAPIQGKFSAVLFGGEYVGGGVTYYSATISQTGLIPNGTASLLVDANYFGIPFVVMLGGQTISMVPLQTFPNHTLYGGDISSFGGQVATLSFTEPPAQPSELVLDNIVFSPLAIPEPGIFGLFGFGALLLGWRLYGRSKNMR
jgi:PEP-CTERM motif-containing protein